MMKYLLQNKIWLSTDQVMYSGSALLLNLYLARVLTMHNFGIFASLIVGAYLILSIAQSLIIQPAQVHLAKVKDCSSYRLFLLLLLACTSIVLIIIGIVLYALPLDMIATYRPYIIIYISYCITFIVFDFFRKYFLAQDYVKASFTIQSLHTVSLVTCIAALSCFGITSLTGIISALSIAYMPSLVIAIIIYTQGISFSEYKIEKSYLAVHLIDGQWLLYTSIVQWLSSNMYVLMSGMLINIEAVGVLRLVQTVFGGFNLYLQMVENHLLPRMAKAFAQCTSSSYTLFKKEYGQIILPGMIALLIVALFAKKCMESIGGISYGQYAMVLQGTCILYAIILLGYGLRIMVRIAGMNKMYFLGYAISLVLSLLMYKYLFHNFGVMGAVMGLILNQLILQLTWVAALIQKQYAVWKLYI